MSEIGEFRSSKKGEPVDTRQIHQAPLLKRIAELEKGLASQQEQWSYFINVLEDEVKHWEQEGATGGPMEPPVSEETRLWLAQHTKLMLDFAKMNRDKK